MDYERYLHHIDQPVVILDKLYQVLLMNAAFEALFPRVERSENLRAFTVDYPALSSLLAGVEGQMPVEHGGRHYNAHISFARYGKNQRPLARCILLTDVTDTVELLAETKWQSELLRETNARIARQNDELRENLRIEREAAALREQALLLRDIHDTLGHTLTMIAAHHNLALSALPDVEAARTELREALQFTGISIASLESAGDYSSGSFAAFLYRFRDSMARVGLEIVPEISGEETAEHQYMYADLVRICQEAATNAIKHGGATRLAVSYTVGGDKVRLLIRDNGRTTKPTGKGYGLRSMDERVNNLFGDFTYGKMEDGGFFVQVDAPLIREEK